MTNDEIQQWAHECYDAIKNAEAKLAELRELCQHEETFEGLYQYRVGSMFKAEICVFCNAVIKGIS
jgi:hypothetical protein